MFIILFIELIYWKIVDLSRIIKAVVKKEKRKPHLFGIYGYFGLPGKGKTIGMTWELERLRKKYGNDIYICTNYFYNGQDFPFTDWKQLLDVYDKPLIVAWDEVQNEFTSRNFKNFPFALLTLLTQNRKGNGIRIMYSAQRYNRVDKVFRELTFYAVRCNTIFGRLTRMRHFHWEDYEQLVTTTNVNQKVKIRPIRTISFVQSDKLRNLYDSFKMLDSAKSKEYMDREEMARMGQYDAV